MRALTVLLLLSAIAWARDCPFCGEPLVAVPVHGAVHYFCRACSGTIYENADGSATATVRVRGGRRTVLLVDKETVSRRHWEIVSMGDLEPNATAGREGGQVAPGHPVARPGDAVTRPGHAVSRPGHPVSVPDHAVKRPSHPVERPAHAVQRPAHAVQRSSHPVERPAQAVKLPSHAVQVPGHAVQVPGHAVSRPGHPVSRPGNVQAPSAARSDGPALLVAPRKWSPPPSRAAPRRYG